MPATVTVIIPVYNAIRHLELALAGFCRQSYPEFELVIADDGSGPEMRAFVEAYKERAPFPLKFVHQPDEGFRKNKILNSAIRVPSTDFLVFVDQDCIPHRKFVQAHYEHRAPGTVLVGRRVDLSEQVTRALTPESVREGQLETMKLSALANALLGKGSHWDEGILLKTSFLRALIGRRKPSLLGSNYSLERSLLDEINGFNEEFVGYGGEDTELEYRLRLAGARLEWVRHQAIQYHLYHPKRSANRLNGDVLERTKARSQAACVHGLKSPET